MYRDPAAQWLGSPNYSAGRPNGIQWIVLHTMVGTIGSADARFQNPAEQASAHYGVGMDGSLVQWVDEGDTAWHAGDFFVNQHSVGIEHEDGGNYNSPRPDALYTASSALVQQVCARYDIPVQRGDVAAGIPGCIDHRTVYATACPDSLDTDRIIKGAQTFGPGGGTIGGDDMTPEEHAWVRVAARAVLPPRPASLGDENTAGHTDGDFLTIFASTSTDAFIAAYGQDGYTYISALYHATPVKATGGGGGTEPPEPAEPTKITLHIPSVPGDATGTLS